MSILQNPKVTLAITGAIGDGASPPVVNASINHTVSLSLPVGTSAGDVNIEYYRPIAVSVGTPLVLDLTNLTDPLGNSISMSVVTAILLSNESTTTGQDLTLGGGTHPLFAAMPVPAQAGGGAVGVLAPASGFAVVSGTSNTLQVTAAAGSGVPGRLTILGR